MYSQLAFSPDRKRIAFQIWEPDGSIDIYVMDLTYELLATECDRDSRFAHHNREGGTIKRTALLLTTMELAVLMASGLGFSTDGRGAGYC